MLPPCRLNPSAAPLLPTTVISCVQVDTKQGADPNWLKQMAEKYNEISGPFQGSGQKLGGGRDICLCRVTATRGSIPLKGRCPTSEQTWQMPLPKCACDASNAEQWLLL